MLFKTFQNATTDKSTYKNAKPYIFKKTAPSPTFGSMDTIPVMTRPRRESKPLPHNPL